MTTKTHDLTVEDPWTQCPLCQERIGAGEVESNRLFLAGASDQEWLDARHKPRFATLAEHRKAFRGQSLA
jgi:hypothetical protein